MRILFTIPNFETAGSGHALFQLALGLKNRGHDVHIMAKHDKGKLIESIRKSGIELHIWNFESNPRPILTMLKSVFITSKEFRKIKPDVIYSYHYTSDYTEGLSCLFSGVPWVYVKKNMSWYGPSKNAWILRSFLAHRIIVQNTEMVKEFLYRFKKKLDFIAIGVDMQKFQPSTVSRRDTFTFLHISSLLPVKGIQELVEAYSLFCEKDFHNHQLIICGNDNTAYIESIKHKYAHIDSLFFVGEISNVNDYLSESHCFIQSTLNTGRREGAPIALQEAMASGLISLGARVAGINDQLREFSEFQFDSFNSIELQEKMQMVFNLSQAERDEIGLKMRRKMEKDYSLDAEIVKVEQMLFGLIS